MVDAVTVQDLFNQHQAQLGLVWLAGQENSSKTFKRDPEDISSLVGYLNFVHPQQVTILGVQEFDYLARLDVSAYTEAINQLFKANPTLIVIADTQTATDEILELAHKNEVCLVTASKRSRTVIDYLAHFLATRLAATIIVHGVFMEVFDLGVLLAGDSGIGKSELALELINRGHRLVADDSPLFARLNPSELTGSCPPLLRDYLEVRGLGVLNIRAMFGSIAVKYRKQLHLIVRIIDCYDEHSRAIDRLHGIHRSRDILSVNIPEVSVPVAPGRNLAILIEAAVRNHVLKLSGYDASTEFDLRQQKSLDMSHDLHCH